MARTGFSWRFLIGDHGLNFASRVILTCVIGMITLRFSVIGLLVVPGIWSRAVDPQGELHRLRRPPSAAEQTRGIVRGPAQVAPETPMMGLCRIEHQHLVVGKGGGWRTDATFVLNQQAILRVGHTRYRLQINVDRAPFQPQSSSVVPHSTVVTQLPDLAARYPEGRFLAQCAEPGSAIFVEGCRTSPGILSDCPAGHLGSEHVPLRITTSGASARPRIDAVAAATTAEVAGAGLGLLVVFCWMWFFLRARPVVEPLLARAGAQAPTSTPWETSLILAPIVMAALASVLAGSDPTMALALTYIQVIAVASAAIILAVVVHRRRKRLEVAMRPVLAATTISLREAQGEMVELCVKTTAETSIVGPVSGRPRAWVRVAVYETYNSEKNQRVTALYATSARPRRIAVQDASGEGEVDPEGVEPDIRAVHRQFLGDSARPLLDRLRQDFDINLHPHFKGHVHWTVEESFLDPGEAIYLLGDVRRVDDPEAAASYRGGATRPIVGGGNLGLILHAGDERSLLTLLRRERRWLALFGAASVGLALCVAGMAAWMATL